MHQHSRAFRIFYKLASEHTSLHIPLELLPLFLDHLLLLSYLWTTETSASFLLSLQDDPPNYACLHSLFFLDALPLTRSNPGRPAHPSLWPLDVSPSLP